MKRIVLSAALLALAVFTVNVSADEAGKGKGKKRGAAAQGERGGNQGGPRGGMDQRDPAQLVGRMMSQFDKDGDEKLDVTELTALMQSLRERRGGQAGGPRGGAGQAGGPRGKAGGPRGGQGRPDGARGRRGGDSDGQGTKGGERPKRPE